MSLLLGITLRTSSTVQFWLRGELVILNRNLDPTGIAKLNENLPSLLRDWLRSPGVTDFILELDGSKLSPTFPFNPEMLPITLKRFGLN